MKMVRVGGKRVPFFAADGKGSNDLKKAMYGMKVKRAEEGTKVSGYKTTVLGGQYTSDSPYGDVRRRTVSERNLNTSRLQREFIDRLEYFMEKYPSMDIEDARQEVMKRMAEDHDFMSRIDLMETARRGRPSDTQAGKRLMMGAGGKVKMYEEGGPIVTRDKDSQRFRVIPAPVDPSNPDSELEARFYVGGREVPAKEFASMLPEGTNINEMVRQGYEEARPTYNRAEKKWGYTPTRYFQAAVAERKAYEAKGKEGMEELEMERDQSAAKRYQEMGGHTAKAVPGASFSI